MLNKYKVLSVDPAIRIHQKKVPVFVNGDIDRIENATTEYNVGVCTDGTEYQGEFVEFSFSCPVGLVSVGDLISGFVSPQRPSHVQDVVVEIGEGGCVPAAPAPAVLPSEEPICEEAPEVDLLAAALMNRSLSARDVAELAARFLRLEQAFDEHLKTCTHP